MCQLICLIEYHDELFPNSSIQIKTNQQNNPEREYRTSLINVKVCKIIMIFLHLNQIVRKKRQNQ